LSDDLNICKKISISTEIRGIQTADKRKYLFNLHTLLPKDYNFTNAHEIQKYPNQNLNSTSYTVYGE
jgi:hypothetical protein